MDSLAIKTTLCIIDSAFSKHVQPWNLHQIPLGSAIMEVPGDYKDKMHEQC